MILDTAVANEESFHLVMLAKLFVKIAILGLAGGVRLRRGGLKRPAALEGFAAMGERLAAV